MLSVHFKGAEHRDTLKRIDLLHENITLQSQPVPNLGELFTSHPLNRGNKEILDATFPSIWSPLPGCTVKCRVETSSGGPQFFFKVVMHVDAGEDTLQFEAARLLMYEACFYSQHLSEFQGRIVPRHYGLFVGETTWGGRIVCSYGQFPRTSMEVD